MNTIGDRIKFLRNKEKLSMEQLANKIKLPIIKSGQIEVNTKSVSSATISNAENNKHSPSLELIIALAKYFDVTLDWLVLGEVQMNLEKETRELVNEYILSQERTKIREEYILKAKQFIAEEAEQYLTKKFDDYLTVKDIKIEYQKEQEE